MRKFIGILVLILALFSSIFIGCTTLNEVEEKSNDVSSDIEIKPTPTLREWEDSILLRDDISEAEIKARKILTIRTARANTPNSAGGVDVLIRFRNPSEEKVIKYIVFYAEAYNRVGDLEACTIRGNYESGGMRVVGPISNEDVGEGLWSNVWYNYSIESLELTKINIDYMDGSNVILEGDDLKFIQNRFYKE